MDRPHHTDPALPRPRHLPPDRLRIPARFSTALGYDAVGLPREHGRRVMECLPRVGCVFGDDLRWWWIVPSGSHIGVVWPPSSAYAVGGHLTDPSWTHSHRPQPEANRPRLIHAPRAGSPYTPPIPLYFLTCRLAGSAPRWTPHPVG